MGSGMPPGCGPAVGLFGRCTKQWMFSGNLPTSSPRNMQGELKSIKGKGESVATTISSISDDDSGVPGLKLVRNEVRGVEAMCESSESDTDVRRPSPSSIGEAPYVVKLDNSDGHTDEGAKYGKRSLVSSRKGSMAAILLHSGNLAVMLARERKMDVCKFSVTQCCCSALADAVDAINSGSERILRPSMIAVKKSPEH